MNTERIVRLQLWEPIEYQHSSTPLAPDVSKQDQKKNKQFLC